MYYDDKREILKDVFGANTLTLEARWLVADARVYPIVDDVIILLDRSQYPAALAEKLGIGRSGRTSRSADLSEDIQFGFSEEWKSFSDVLAEPLAFGIKRLRIRELSGTPEQVSYQILQQVTAAVVSAAALKVLEAQARDKGGAVMEAVEELLENLSEDTDKQD